MVLSCCDCEGIPGLLSHISPPGASVKLWILPEQKDRSFERSRFGRTTEQKVGKNTELTEAEELRQDHCMPNKVTRAARGLARPSRSRNLANTRLSRALFQGADLTDAGDLKARSASLRRLIKDYIFVQGTD